MANSFLSRLQGLLGRNRLTAGSGLLITPSSGVHTFGMRFSIDILSLDKNLRVLGVWNEIGPGKIRAMHRKTFCVLELPSGSAAQSLVAVGDQLVLEPCPAQAA